MENDILRIEKENSIFPKGAREYLVFPCRYLVPGSIAEEEDFFELKLDTDGLSSAYSLPGGQAESRYRFLIACAELEGFRAEYSFSLDPENLMYDAAFTPKVRKRDGAKPSDGEFAKEYKALVFSILAPEYSYTDYMEGGGDLCRKSKALAELALADSSADIKCGLIQALSELEKRLEKDSMLVSRGKYKLMRILLIVFICLFGASGALFVKTYMIDGPRKDTAIEISDKYLARDYMGVLSAVSGVDIKTLSEEERYMAAYAGVATASLNSNQRNAVMQAVTLQTDSLYLDYWLDIGIGDFEGALDISRRIGDDELELYALVIYRDSVSVDMDISGAEKAERLKGLDEEINTLTERIDEAGRGDGADE